MEEDISSINKNDTWDLMELSKGKKHVRCKWIYKIKYNVNGSIERYKERLVTKGLTQLYGIYYEEKFSPIVRQEIVKLVLPLAAHKVRK